MKAVLMTILAMGTMAGPVFAASVTNNDERVHTLVVTENSGRAELIINSGETIEFCPDGCFVTMPNGDREALTGAETIEIIGGRGRIQ